MSVLAVLEPREVPLGGTRAMLVRRTLPHRDLRTIGAWCFVDSYGPDAIGTGPGMQVPPHPHVGLQTVTWLLDGEVLHRDSLGSEALIRPGELNLMTAGHGIAHSEESPAGHGLSLQGVQLWVALPDAARAQAAHFEHHADLPVLDVGPARVTVLAGEVDGAVSPAATYSPLVGAEVALPARSTMTLPLRPDFEHGMLALDGEVSVAGTRLPLGALAQLGPGETSVEVATDATARVMLLGGEPFDEELVMWWNFVARDSDEIAAAREDWAAGRRFGEVLGYPGDPLRAPALPAVRLRPRGRSRR